jgi:hypothetical protein
MNTLVGLIALLSILLGAQGAERRQPAGPDPGPGPTPPPPPPPWHSVAPNPANGTDHGTHASMTVARYFCGGGWGSCTRIDIVHQRKGFGAGLIYTWSDDGGATFRHTAIHYGANVGAYAAVAAGFSGQVTASYHARTGENDNHLWIARQAPPGEGNCGAGSAWQCTPLESEGGEPAAMTSDAARHVYVAYERSNGHISIWNDNPDDSVGSPMASGNALDLAVDAINRVHLAWTGGRCLYYQYWSPSAWSERETVDCAPDDTPPSNPGRVSIEVDRSWHPRIAYTLPLAGGGHRIKHAYKTDAYTWHREQVAFVPANSLQPGLSILLTPDESDTAAISYGITSSIGDRLVVARPGGPPPFNGWPTEVADALGGGYSSLGWVQGRLAVAHHDAVNKKLRFSKRDY